MEAGDQLPFLPPAAALALAACVGTLWLLARVAHLRRLEEQREPDTDPPPAWGWLRAIASWRLAGPALVLLALAFALLAGLLRGGPC